MRASRIINKQTDLAEQQLDLARNQLKIAERQDEILAMRADLRAIGILLQAPDARSARLALRIRNDGRRGARDYYWHLWVPASTASEITGSDPSDSVVVRRQPRDGIDYFHFEGAIDEPLYPTREREVLTLTLANLNCREIEMRWQIVAEDGLFTSEDHEAIRLDVACGQS